VLENLLANSLKFTPRGGKVRVKVEKKAGRLEIVVEDSGPGIPKPERATLFERYRQGAQGRSRGGAGLGLAIARGITEAHGGTVACEDSALGGAAFRVSLPA
jgi:signal transduction histidine kinase